MTEAEQAQPSVIPDVTKLDGITPVFHQQLGLDLRDMCKHFAAKVSRQKPVGPKPPKWASELKRLRWDVARLNAEAESFRMWCSLYEKRVLWHQHAVVVMATMDPADPRRFAIEVMERASQYLDDAFRVFAHYLGAPAAVAMADKAREFAIRPGSTYQPQERCIEGVAVLL